MRQENIGAYVDDARLSGFKPRVHGNGFIQLDVNERCRMHFWGHPDIPRACPLTPIHDHVFDFESEVLRGEILNLDYDEHHHAAGLYAISKAAPVKLGENGWGLLPTGERLDLTLRTITRVKEGESYFMPSFIFHQTVFDGPAVTILDKKGATLAQNPDGPKPRVLHVFGHDPQDIRFRRDGHDVDKLWGIIRELVAS